MIDYWSQHGEENWSLYQFITWFDYKCYNKISMSPWNNLFLFLFLFFLFTPSKIYIKGLGCSVCLLMLTVYWHILQDFYRFSFHQSNCFGSYKSFQKNILETFDWKKLWQRRLPSKQGCCRPVQSPSWSPWPPWPCIYTILWNFLIEKTASCKGAGNICLFYNAVVCWDERNIESL